MKAFIVGFLLIGVAYSIYELDLTQYLVGYWYYTLAVVYLPVGVLTARMSYLIDKHIAKSTDAYNEGGQVAAMILLWPTVLAIQLIALVCIFTYRVSMPGLKIILSFVRS